MFTSSGFRERIKDNKEEGFTLIELLVVILIIGILSAIAIPAFLNQRKSAVEASLKSDLKTLGVTLETEAIKNKGKYPTTLPTSFKSSTGNVFSIASAESGTTNVASSSTGFYSNSAYPTTAKIDDYTRASYSQASYGGPYWWYTAPFPAGTTFSGSVEVRSNVDVCFQLQIEQHKTTPGWNTIKGPNTCLTAGEWKEVTVTGQTEYDITQATLVTYSQHTAPSTFDYKTPVLVFGGAIDKQAIAYGSDERYCVEGYSESDPSNIWSYSKLKGGVKQGKC